MTTARFVDQPCAVISGSGAFLLSQLLDTPQVRAYRRNAPWAQTGDVEAAIGAIHAAGRAWQSTVELPQRHPAPRCERTTGDHGTMTTDQAAATLNLSRRRIQELARSKTITGHRNGQRWQLNRDSVTAYRRRERN